VEPVLEELEEMHARSGRTLFLFQDNILPLDRKRFSKLMEGFRRLSFPFQWKCFARVDLMDTGLMEEMASSGCVQIRYGIESGSNPTLRRINKGFTIEKAYQVAEESVRRFPSVHASFIWGYPFETNQEFETTLDWVSKFEEMGVTMLLFEFSPLPGSKLYQEHEKNLTFSPDSYSFFVVTGQEEITGDGFQTGLSDNPVHRLIRDHPHIFSGFYKYQQTSTLWKHDRLAQFRLSGRTRARNEYDL
jgi:radical SAM superfamily enzyme YgiQ (UPF0313 family)